MFRPIRMDHTKCLQVTIKTILFMDQGGSVEEGDVERGISNGFTEFITNRVLYPPIILL